MKRLLLLLAFCIISIRLVAQNDVKPFVLGEIRQLRSQILGEMRTLNVYLPDGYNGNDTTRYPVIYLLDGSADEDFIHIAGLVQFANFSWVNLLPKSIIVGIANVDRKRDYTFPSNTPSDKEQEPTSGGSEKFIAFIEQELQHFVDSVYHTSVLKTIIGQSLGGLVATEILYKKPQLFTNYIIVSPSLWWDSERLLKQRPIVLQGTFKQATTVYIAIGKEEEVMVKDAESLYKTLANKRKNLKVHLQHFEKENHATILHQAVYDAFKTINPRQ